MHKISGTASTTRIQPYGWLWLWWYVFLWAISACGPSATDSVSDIEQIRARAQQFSADLVGQHYDAIAAAHTSDARLFPPGQPIVTGREAIRAYWTPSDTSKSRITMHRMQSEEIEVTGHWAYDWGRYAGTSTRDSVVSHWAGKYVMLWKKGSDGVWRIYSDIWNRSPGSI